jgi:hypothetical protein
VKRLRALGLGGTCLAGLGLACAYALSAATTGCTTHQCDTDFVNLDPPDASVLVGNVQTFTGTNYAIWESSPLEGPWIDFPGQMTYFFELPQYFLPSTQPQVWLGTDPIPNDPDASPTTVNAAGQLAEMFAYVNGGFKITNGTCAEYYLYVTIQGTYSPPAPPAPDDAGAD